MNKKTLLFCTVAASLSFSTVAYALCVELTTYRPWDPTWISAAVRASSSANYPALRVLGNGTSGARFRSDATVAVDTTTNVARYGLWAKAESSTGNTIAVLAESSAPGGAVVQLQGGTSGPLIDAYSGGQSVFRVDSDGTITVRGAPILQKGPPGVDAAYNGVKGDSGARGAPGQDNGVANYAACVQQSCRHICLHGVVDEDNAPCTATNAAGRSCTNNNNGGHCCVCDKP